VAEMVCFTQALRPMRANSTYACRPVGQLVCASQMLRVMPDGQRVVEEADGIDALEALELQSHPQLQAAAAGLVDTYFGEDYGL